MPPAELPSRPPYSLEPPCSPGERPRAGARLPLPPPCHACRTEPPSSLGLFCRTGESHGREYALLFLRSAMPAGRSRPTACSRQTIAGGLACNPTAWERSGAASHWTDEVLTQK